MARDGMAGDFFRRNGFVNLRYMPDPKTEYVANFENLTGGMNIFDLEYKLKPNESPMLKNLTWRNGHLGCRRGQLPRATIPGNGPVYEMYPGLYHDKAIVHSGAGIFAWAPKENTITRLVSGVPQNGGTFFRYNDDLFYKNRGAYIRIFYDASDENAPIKAAPMSNSPEGGGDFCAYVPTVSMNADPTTGAGDEYQPENRLSGWKRITYNAAQLPSVGGWTIYKLPVSGVTDAMVYVSGAKLTKDLDFILIGDEGKVMFRNAPPVTIPPTNNTVEILYYKANDTAYNNIMDCSSAIVFGGARDLCVVMAGSETQRNAYFWTGNDNVAMNPTYFPMSQYNLAGDASEAITGFGKQQNMLVIFKEHSVGRATFSTEKINDREQITMDYTAINAETGCDLPRTIQLIDNNLVWANRQSGVHVLRDSSAAYENNIVCISKKINGDYRRDGLFALLKNADPAKVCSVDTDRKYILAYNGEAYEWNYTLSEYSDPSWFYHTGIRAAAFAQELDKLWEATTDGIIAEYARTFSDFDEQPIEKVYTLPTQYFGSYDRLKNINSVLFSTEVEARLNAQIEWRCDWAKRIDPTPLVGSTYSLVPRNLTYRDLSCSPYPHVARRKPGWHNVHHFALRLSNNQPGEDLSVGSIQIFYTYRGRTR